MGFEIHCVGEKAMRYIVLYGSLTRQRRKIMTKSDNKIIGIGLG